jgi:hypothetical protein
MHLSLKEAFENAIDASSKIYGEVTVYDKTILNWFLDRRCIDIASSPERISTARYPYEYLQLS